jgi:hypothetical protein
VIPFPILDFWGDDIRKGVMAEVGQRGHTTRWRGLGLARATSWCGALVAHLALSVVGMTIWVGQGQSHLPADVLGITATFGRRGRLEPKGRLW